MNRVLLAKIFLLPTLVGAVYALTPMLYRSHVDEGFPVAAALLNADVNAQEASTMTALQKVTQFTSVNGNIADGVAMLFSFEDRAVLRLENMFVSNAHHLQIEVELSQLDGTTIWHSVGSLKADTGAFNYDLDSGISAENIVAVRIIQPITQNVFGIAEFKK